MQIRTLRGKVAIRVPVKFRRRFDSLICFLTCKNNPDNNIIWLANYPNPIL